MKIRAFLLSIISLLSICSSAQKGDEGLIRLLEDKEREAILKSDTIQLHIIMAKDIVVHNPENSIAGLRQIMDRIRSGKINYEKFERRIDSIVFVKGMAVVMGEERVKPRGETKHAGKTVVRRFTNIWTKETTVWKLTIRHATIISVE